MLGQGQSGPGKFLQKRFYNWKGWVFWFRRTQYLARSKMLSVLDLTKNEERSKLDIWWEVRAWIEERSPVISIFPLCLHKHTIIIDNIYINGLGQRRHFSHRTRSLVFISQIPSRYETRQVTIYLFPFFYCLVFFNSFFLSLAWDC